jgi:uncharacterized membrane protein required for colicin V production
MIIFYGIVVLFIVGKIIQGYKRGMVKEIISAISLIFLCCLVVLLGLGLQSYVKKEIAAILVVVILLGVLAIAHHLISLVLLPAKLLAKLPVIKWLDKLLGMVVGAVEVLLVLWVVDALVLTFYQKLGILGELIVSGIAGNPVLAWISSHNMVLYWLQNFSSWT